jgi:DNA recombination protein RmuC
MMDYLPLIVTALVTVGLTLFFVRIWFQRLEKKTETSQELVEWMKELGRRVEFSTESVDKKLTQNMEQFNTRLDRASHIIAQVQHHIGSFAEMGKSMKELQEFLQSPKLRGNIGEQILKDLLALHFPHDSFTLQHTFQSGEKVDAIIKTAHGIIPIDSKFPIENFRHMIDAEGKEAKEQYRKEFGKDVKKHIQDIAKKYILPAENTVDYALMYIPSEAVYYEIVNTPDLYDYASQKRVLPVSPLTFYAYMKAILMSFEGEKIQKQAQEIIQILQSLQKDYEKSEESLATLTKHMTNAQNQLMTFNRYHQALGQKLESTRSLGE